MIAHTTSVVITNLVSAAAEGGEHAGRTHHNAYLVGVCTFVFLILCLMITLTFNRDR